MERNNDHEMSLMRYWMARGKIAAAQRPAFGYLGAWRAEGNDYPERRDPYGRLRLAAYRVGYDTTRDIARV
jgi:hypothetical protein